MSEEKEITYEDLSSYEKTRAYHGLDALRGAIGRLQDTNNMRIVFREELAAINKAFTSIQEKRGETV